MALQATRSHAGFEGTVVEVTEAHVNTAHAFWNDATPEQRMADVGYFARHVALFGATCVMASLPVKRTVQVHRA